MQVLPTVLHCVANGGGEVNLLSGESRWTLCEPALKEGRNGDGTDGTCQSQRQSKAKRINTLLMGYRWIKVEGRGRLMDYRSAPPTC